MTQPADIVPHEQPPALCPVCATWAIMPYAARPTTPINPHEALNIMCVGFWLASRGHTEPHLCALHAEVLTRLDFQKHTREEWERTEKLRIEEEARQAAIEAAKPKYPSTQHANIAADLIGRLAQVNAPPNQRQPIQHPAMIAAAADPNTFPCPDCKKPIRNGEVHSCAAPAGQ